jgi:RNA polymerase primary sigma factor
MKALKGRLANHQFGELFREELGWERASGEIAIEIDGRSLRFETVSQKRGFRVLVCATGRRTLFNRGLLQRAQKEVMKFVHEHILIFACRKPPKQVWLWAVKMPDGRRVRHREHPFFSALPPEKLLSRLLGLRFSLDEEEDATLLDAVERVRNALDVEPELDLFAKRPRYAERSDELAIAMKNGDVRAFHQFVVFHRPLARHGSKHLRRWFGMDEEDAEQIAILGLMQAARRFEPERGFQFSTYATHWIRQACQRFGPDAALFIRIPQHALWPCFHFRRHLVRVSIREGIDAAREELHRMCADDVSFYDTWRRFERATAIDSLSDRNVYRAARHLVDPGAMTLNVSVQTEQSALLRQAIEHMQTRDAMFLRMRHGIDCSAHTLEQIGVKVSLTRERVRQILKRAEGRLSKTLEGVVRQYSDEETART